MDLIPDYFDGLEHVTRKKHYAGILQKINPMATKTTIGCPNLCRFCKVGQSRKGFFAELNNWPDFPVLTDNNLLAASSNHFDKVIDRLKKWGWCDFNQGLDIRLLSSYHAKRIAEIKKPIVRLSLDSLAYKAMWQIAYDRLRSAGIAKANIRSYVLIGYNDDPITAWDKCNWIEKHGIKVFPMWFHPLDAMKHNVITDNQQTLGWNKKTQREIMGFFYQHRGKRQRTEI